MEYSNNVIPIERSRHFSRIRYPHQVVSDPNLDADEKRAFLSAWASDRRAVESLPALRHLPATPFPVTSLSIMDARAQLDRLAGANDDDPPHPPGAIRRLRGRRLFMEAA
jgi:hypothetical protein